jgi:hypothetical protein
MPQIAADMASNMGDVLTYDMYAPGGYTLDDHYYDPITAGKIKAGNWDYMVLQEQSQLPAFPNYYTDALPPTGFYEYNPCGRVMFYMTWGRKNGDAGNCAMFPYLCTYLGMDSALRNRYIQLADIYNTELSPAGAAWRYVRQNNPGIELYDTDGSHPSQAGSYLIAACFYAAIFKKNPALISYDYSLSPATANILRQAAKKVVFDSLSHWSYIEKAPVSDFYYNVIGNNQIICVNKSMYADNYLWDFGDGNTSTQAQPTHTYANDGTYTIKLTSYNCDLDGAIYTNTYQQTISFCSFTPTVTPIGIVLCPGKTDTLWTESYDAYQWYTWDGNIIPNANKQYLVCTGGNKYAVRATKNGCTEESIPTAVDNHGNLIAMQLMADGKMRGKDTACLGDTIMLSLMYNKPPFPNDTLLSWSRNGQTISNSQNDSLMITIGGTYKVAIRHPICQGLEVSREINFTFLNCNPGNVDDRNEPTFSVYPNPSNGYFSLYCPKQAEVQAYDVYGKRIASYKLDKGINNIDLHTQPAGIYLLKISSGSTQHNLRIVKE